MSKSQLNSSSSQLNSSSSQSTDLIPLVKHAYSPRTPVLVTCGESMTKQSFKDECDINTIMSRYMQTGVLPSTLNPQSPQYIDATGFDFDLAMNLVAEASSAFAQLPSAVRAKFNDDPGSFLDFAADPQNRSQMVEMGLLTNVPEWAKGVGAGVGHEAPTQPKTPKQNENPSTTAPEGS